MAIKAQQFGGKGSTIQVGGLSTVDAKVTVANTGLQFDANADRIVEIQDYSGSVVWLAIKATNDITNPSAANGNACIPPYGVTRPFVLKAGQYIEASGTVNIRALDIQEV
jgi:hypothetical protein